MDDSRNYRCEKRPLVKGQQRPITRQKHTDDLKSNKHEVFVTPARMVFALALCLTVPCNPWPHHLWAPLPYPPPPSRQHPPTRLNVVGWQFRHTICTIVRAIVTTTNTTNIYSIPPPLPNTLSKPHEHLHICQQLDSSPAALNYILSKYPFGGRIMLVAKQASFED